MEVQSSSSSLSRHSVQQTVAKKQDDHQVALEQSRAALEQKQTTQEAQPQEVGNLGNNVNIKV
jgi:hypothetical protein